MQTEGRHKTPVVGWTSKTQATDDAGLESWNTAWEWDGGGRFLGNFLYPHCFYNLRMALRVPIRGLSARIFCCPDGKTTDGGATPLAVRSPFAVFGCFGSCVSLSIVLGLFGDSVTGAGVRRHLNGEDG